ncbi:ABC transporter ATP-binding protein [Falsirhodobacter halotolerans]|uniref:ABC transporter ATP-binding protein n=1 Tax=Falsirhodobacter halotolerans TaxID=1146892 RepID=UPI001FD2AF21|nr:ABC transporter ATP-binding protein [Falsirhodobacter halotolerans]MCJ8141156.1 ABC transporter ATP-binding protein [Falsirhodobacter halotolerans]
MIELDNLSKHYGDTRAVDDVSLRIENGSVTAIVGTSGSGKSTLLRLVNGLVTPTSGTVRIDGVDTRDIPAHDLRRRIGYVIQDHGLFPHWTAARNIGCVPALLSWPQDRIDARVAELMRLLQLDPDVIGPRFPHQLSGGQAQRVGVARALAAEPSVLLMDEPFGALDPAIRAQAQTDLAAIQARLGTTILLITHDMAEATRLADRVAVMRAGRIEQFGTPMDILAAPETPFVRSLVPEGDRPFRILSLGRVEALVEPGPSTGPDVADSASLADALALMIRSGHADLRVTTPEGRPLGRLRREAVIAAGAA